MKPYNIVRDILCSHGFNVELCADVINDLAFEMNTYASELSDKVREQLNKELSDSKLNIEALKQRIDQLTTPRVVSEATVKESEYRTILGQLAKTKRQNGVLRKLVLALLEEEYD